MFAIIFNLDVENLKKNYGEPYNKAYDDIRQELERIGFKWTQENIYINTSPNNSL